ncbi:MAG: tetratricopeptide repeat protein [Elusimicrobia bacterium]|jgi:tetratricopeptide (TPR) repeat protein|nr:tetratricopeptide repeat protein [Elusimicrobiota bacterium]
MSSNIFSLPGRAHVPVTKGEKVAQWIVTHRAQLGLALVTLILAGGLAGLIVVNRKKLQEGGILQLAKARYQASQGAMKEALGAIDEVINTQRTNAVGMQAYILKGDILFSDRKFEEAAKNYRAGFGQASLPAYKVLMLAGQASSAVELQQYKEAIGFYDQLVRDYPDHFLVPRAYMELGRLHSALQQWAEAKVSYERLLTLYSKSPWAVEAEVNLAAVAAKLPSERPVPEPIK